MVELVALPPMDEAQKQSWHALMDLYEKVSSDWTLIGGQLVHLHCAERGAVPSRATNDIDAVVDVRAAQKILETFTRVLKDMGFTPQTSGDGVQHRWCRDLAQIDVLIPEGVGERAAGRAGAGGLPTVRAPGTTQALTRSEPVSVLVEGRTGTILRPDLVGALVAKAAARLEISADPAGGRHCSDFVVLAGLVAARDFRGTVLERKDRTRLSRMIGYCRNDSAAMSLLAAADALARLERAVALTAEPTAGIGASGYCGRSGRG